jgi:AsmA protein
VKKILLVLAGIVALLLVIALVLPFVIDVNKFKPTLEADISKALGRQIQIGNIELSIFSGGVKLDDVSIADDPAFSHSPFLTAKQLSVGVSLLPLIISQKLEVRSFTVVEPEVSLLRSASGMWNFSSLGAGKAKSASSKSEGPSPATDFSVEKLAITHGRITLGAAGGGAHGKPQIYDELDLEASDLSYTSQFPFKFSAKTPGNGKVTLEGKAGPIDAADASLTPLEANISVQHLDIAATGFLNPAAGLAGLIGFTGDLNSNGQQMSSKGSLKAEKIVLVAAGSPSSVPLDVDYNTKYDLKRQTGVLEAGEVHIGKAVAHLSGTYDIAGSEATIQIKMKGEGMSVPDMEGLLPALGVKLPPGAALQSGTLDADLAISGQVDKLTITGPINLANAKLTGFDLKSKLGALGSFAGLPKALGSDTEIQTLSTDVHMDSTGTHAQNLKIVIPSIGTVTGDGNLSSTGQLDCKMSANLPGAAGAMTSALTTFGNSMKSQGGGIPFKIEGTTSNPIFLPDVAGMAGNFGKGAVKAPENAVGAATSVLGGLLGKKKKSQ